MKRDKRRKDKEHQSPTTPSKSLTYKKNNEILLLEIARFEENLILFIINLVLQQLALFVNFRKPYKLDRTKKKNKK